MAVTITDYIADSEAFYAGPETITITNEGFLREGSSNGVAALVLAPALGILTVTVNGGIDGDIGGISIGATALTTASKVTVGANGQVNSSGGYALDAAHATNLTNSGVMQSADGIRITGGATSFAIVNSGLITADNGTALLLTGTAAATHTITNNDLIYGDIDASLSVGADRLTSYGLIDGDVDLGDGANYFISKGQINGDVNTGIGIDTFLNYSEVTKSVNLGDGNDLMTNNLHILGSVELGKGNDKFTNAGDVVGNIFMGEGDDTLIAGKYADYAFDEAGKDSYDLGDGLDVFDAVVFGANKTDSASEASAGVYHIDTIQGGLQAGADLKRGTASIFGDVYDATEATVGIVMNLDSATHYDVVNGALSTATKAAYTVTSTEIGQDTVKGFEDIRLGAGNDLAFGTVNADKISGNSGADAIYGGKGNDYLLGDAGADDIVGEAGRDILEGGADADTFHYRAIADSTLAYTGRDRIMDFTDGSDIIDLSNLSTTTITFGGVDQNFNDTVGVTDAPEIRVLTTSFGYTIQVDTTGDNKADFAIDIENAAHNITWTGADFVL